MFEDHNYEPWEKNLIFKGGLVKILVPAQNWFLVHLVVVWIVEFHERISKEPPTF
jgi:hypothetical protein